MENKIDELAKALSKLQGKVLNATKDKQGAVTKTGQVKYNYADLASILEIARPLMSEHGLSLIQMPTTSSQDCVGLTSILMHDSGQSITSFFEFPLEVPMGSNGYPSMTKAQAGGSVITYMRRYALAAILGIAQTDEDAELQTVKRATKKVDEDALKKAIEDIRKAESMEQLQEIFMGLDAKVRTKVNGEKDKKKQELSHAQ